MTTTATATLRERYIAAIQSPEYDDSIPGMKAARAAADQAWRVRNDWGKKLQEARKMRASAKKDAALAEAEANHEVASLANEAALAKVNELAEPVSLERHLELLRIQTELVSATFLLGGAQYLHKTEEDWGVAILDEPVFEYTDEHGPVFAIETSIVNGPSGTPPQYLRIKLSFQRDVRFTIVPLSYGERDERNPRLRKELHGEGQVILKNRKYDEDEEVTVGFPSVSYQSVENARIARAVVEATIQLAEHVQRLLVDTKETK